MKIDAARVDNFLKNPGSTGVVLIYGPDSGLSAERAACLARGVLGGADDPFRYAEIGDAERLLEEAMAASLTGGRRVVRLKNAGDEAAAPVAAILKNPPDTLVILEAGELAPKSRLRALAEKDPGAAAIACYPVDAARLPRDVADRLKALGVRIEPDAASWVGANIAGDEAAIRQAVELLYLYAGREAQLRLADVTAALTDSRESSIQDAVDAALTGEVAAADLAMTRCYDEGVSPVAVLRVLLGELMRLRLAAAQMAAGASAREAVAGLRPPVFFKRVAAMARAASLWPEPALLEAIRAGLAAEAACKSTHIPDHAYCRQFMLGLASRARAKGRR